jgi:hypothetical protein
MLEWRWLRWACVSRRRRVGKRTVRADPLLDFKKTAVGFFGGSLWTSRDALMAPLVVKSFKNRVTVKDPSILPFLSSTVIVSPVTDYRRDR